MERVNLKVSNIFVILTVSWYDIAAFVFDLIKKPKKQIKIIPVKSKQFKSNVVRPKNSLFDHSDIEKTLNEKLPFWKDDITPIIEKLIQK